MFAGKWSLKFWTLLMKGTPFSRDLFWEILNNDGWRVYFLVHRCERRKSFHKLAYGLKFFKSQRD